MFTSCGGGSSSSSSSVSSEMSVSEDGVTVIPMNARPGDVLNLSDFAESIELIPLETTDDCLIGWIPEIIATKNHYVLISGIGPTDFQHLYVYDKNGKFIRQISGRGQGGEEFLEVRDIDVIGDSIIKMGDVYVIRTFNLEGKQLSSKRINGTTQEIVSVKGKTILFDSGSYSSSKATNLLFQFDEKDDLQAEFFEIPPLANRITAFFVNPRALTRDEESVYFHFPYNNYIYQINAETLEYSPRYKVDYGDRTFTWDMFDENVGHVKDWVTQSKNEKNASMCEILSLNDYFLFTSRDNDRNYYLSLYSNRTGKVLSGNKLKDDMYFKGNVIVLKGGKPSAVLGRHGNDGGDLIWPVQPKVLLKGYKAYREVLSKERWELFRKKYPRLVEVCEQLNEDDNPVLLKIKLKDF
ncbi:MAG: 6-bladed beta-propeller [Bacteroides sp.]|nr:6-bladed beta-propeller [Bacteroides sp.]